MQLHRPLFGVPVITVTVAVPASMPLIVMR